MSTHRELRKIEDFDRIFKPIINTNSGDTLFETYGEDLDFVLEISKSNHRKVWTLIDGDNGLVIVSGYRLVNRVHYIVTENEWIDDNDLVLYCDELVENKD